MAAPKTTTPGSGPPTSFHHASDWGAIQLGPSSHLMLIETDRKGRFRYEIRANRITEIQLGWEFALTPLAVIDSLRTTLICDPNTLDLLALHVVSSLRPTTFLFGDLWGHWVDGNGKRHRCADAIDVMKKLDLPFEINYGNGRLTFTYYLNIFNRMIFTRETKRHFSQGSFRHEISLTYSTPSGEFVDAKLVLHDQDTGVTNFSYKLNEFPLVWLGGAPREAIEGSSGAADRPVQTASSAEVDEDPPSPGPSPEVSATKKSDPPTEKSGPSTKGGPKSRASRRRAKLKPRRSARARPAQPPPPGAESGDRAKPDAPPRHEHVEQPSQSSSSYGLNRSQLAGSSFRSPEAKARLRAAARARAAQQEKKPLPLPVTERLSVERMIGVIAEERDEDRRWKMIEVNLMLGRPERTYALISNYSDIIAERTPQWAPVRLRAAFHHQPGAVLIGIMENWHINQILAVADENAESARIIEWLREHEIDRMLRLELDTEITTAGAARRDLHVNRHADPQMVRKVWRTLLGFLNADLGRVDERAIHRKKDEIAKHLQIARDVLMRRL